MVSLPFSFDTIKLLVPLKDPDAVHSVLSSRKTSYNHNTDGSIKSAYLSSWLWPESSSDLLPSSTSVPVASYKNTSDCVCLAYEGSIPKAFIGHSAGHVYDFESFAQTLEQVLLSFGIEPAVPWTEYRVRRLDVCFNFKMDSLNHAEAAYQQLSRLRYRGRLGIVKARESLAYWPSKTCTAKFYLKWKEMIRKDQGYDRAWLDSHSEEIMPLLRYEEEWKGMKLIRFVKTDKIDKVTVSLLSKAFSKRSGSEFIEGVAKQFSNQRPSASVEVALVAIDNLRKPKPLRNFVASLLDQGYEATRARYKQSTFYDLVGKLKDLGYHPSFFETHWDKEFQPCLDLSGYINSGNVYQGLDDEIYTGHFFYDYFRAFNSEKVISLNQAIPDHSKDTDKIQSS